MYITREIESTLERILPQFKVVLVTGARQVGKTTLIKHMFADHYNYVTLDDMRALDLAKNDPALFFRQNPTPLIIDEVQYAPEIFRQIKLAADKSDERGTIILTGSQAYHLMKNVSESLAGRTTILEMPPMSFRELRGTTGRGPFVPSDAPLREKYESSDVWKVIQRGFMPDMQSGVTEWELFYMNYVKSYIERDVRDIIRVTDEIKFYKFLVSLAARTGQLFVASDIARDIEVSALTVQSWASVLEAAGLIHILRPYHSNYSKRLVKAPKVYFMDTGLVCYLLGWNTPRTLENGAMSGSIFETFVVSEILKSYMNAGKGTGGIFYYRDKDGREIDLLIQDGRTLHPVEIKKSAAPGRDMVKHFPALDSISDAERGTGAVVCLAESASYITDDTVALPVEAL